MNRFLHLLAVAALISFTLSCGNRKSAKVEAPAAAPFPDTVSVFDRLSVSGEPLMLSAQALTSEEAILDALYGKDDGYFSEKTPAEEAFFFPEPDIRPDTLARLVRVRYNLAAVLNRVIHSYEVFCRLSSDVTEEESSTRQDTLKWVRATQPALSGAFLKRALEGAPRGALSSAEGFLAAYRTFEGDDGEESAFYRAFKALGDAFNALPAIVTEEQVDEFREGFWEWYDKARCVPEIDDIVRIHLYDSGLPNPDSLQTERIRQAVLAEKDIDRRTILALELVQFDRYEGALLLGDIIESGIYTPYLLEAWISWRANVQMEHSPSSFSVIADNYYDKMRVKCLNTFLRHCQKEDDVRAKCLLENLIICEIVHRQASIAGNESFATSAGLAYSMFIHPRLLEDEGNEE